MIIFIRGLPGSGKTTIANRLADKLNWRCLYVDDFKGEFMNQNPGVSFFREAVPYSYKKTLEELNYIKNNVIIEEIFNNKKFVQLILSFCKNNNIKYQWFKLIRDKKILLSIKRKIRNTLKDFEMMEKQINDIKIDGEIIINNQNIDEGVKQILTKITLQ